MLKKIIFSFFIGIPFFGLAQSVDSALYIFSEVEVDLAVLQQKTFYSKIEKERIEGNKEFLKTWERIVDNPKILEYDFKMLKDVSILSPKNKQFKLITWNLFRDDGTHAFFGYLLVKTTKTIKKGLFKHETIESYDFYRLIDRSATVKYPETYIGSPNKWFGMLYTQLVECDGYYTLIGWDGNDNLIQRKFVDALYFKGNGTPVFGKDIFKFPRKNPKRLMFEYSQEVSMSLRYNENSNQIVFSHLSSKQEGSILDGQFQYYGPDGRFDALQMKKGKWILVEDVEANSDIDPLKNSKKPNPKKQTPVYKPK